MPVVFREPNKFGDFNWMIQQPEYDDVLFLFNDNEEQFFDFRDYRRPGGINMRERACSRGKDNAIIRPYQCQDPQRAVGIPTGNNKGGYRDEKDKRIIDVAFNYVRSLLDTGRYRRVAYSAGLDGRSLGTQIFSPSPEIKEYIVQQIEGLVD